MVRLSKIYTKVGDAGQTMLGDGAIVAKAHTRVEAYGEVDEANAAVGLALRVVLDGAPGREGLSEELTRIQHDLFDVGADLCVPLTRDEKPGSRLRITQGQVDRLERTIDRLNARLSPLDSFVLPGGSAEAAHLHMARTVVRRAERGVARLLAQEPEGTNPLSMVYLNRLSDLLFVMARVANEDGRADVLWVPGANRDNPGSGPKGE